MRVRTRLRWSAHRVEHTLRLESGPENGFRVSAVFSHRREPGGRYISTCPRPESIFRYVPPVITF